MRSVTVSVEREPALHKVVLPLRILKECKHFLQWCVCLDRRKNGLPLLLTGRVKALKSMGQIQSFIYIPIVLDGIKMHINESRWLSNSFQTLAYFCFILKYSNILYDKNAMYGAPRFMISDSQPIFLLMCFPLVCAFGSRWIFSLQRISMH